MKKQSVLSVVVMTLLIGAMSCAAYAKESGMGMMGGKMGGKQKMEGMGHKEMMGDMGMMAMTGGMGMMDGTHIGMMLKDPMVQKELGLTADQKARLKKISLDEKRKLIRGEADVKILLIDLKELMDASMPDNSAIDAKIDEIAGACAGIAKVKIHSMQDAKDVLTPEQHEKCMSMMEKMKMGGKDMKGMKSGNSAKGMSGMKTKKAVKGEKMKGKGMK